MKKSIYLLLPIFLLCLFALPVLADDPATLTAASASSGSGGAAAAAATSAVATTSTAATANSATNTATDAAISLTALSDVQKTVVFNVNSEVKSVLFGQSDVIGGVKIIVLGADSNDDILNINVNGETKKITLNKPDTIGGANIEFQGYGISNKNAVIFLNGESKQIFMNVPETVAGYNVKLAGMSMEDKSAKIEVNGEIKLLYLNGKAEYVNPVPPAATTTTSTTTTTTPLPTATNTANNVVAPSNTPYGFRYMWYQCYDGTSANEGSESSCKNSETWQIYAKQRCEGRCYADKSKCGVNSFSVNTECGDKGTAPAVPTIAVSGGAGGSAVLPTTSCPVQEYDATKKMCYDSNMIIIKKVDANGCVFLACGSPVNPTATAVPSAAGVDMQVVVAATSPGVSDSTCIDQDYSKEINNILTMITDAEQKNDVGMVGRLKSKMEYLQKETAKSKENCIMKAYAKPVPALAPSASAPSAVGLQIASCNNLGIYKEKLGRYTQMKNDPEKLKAKGIDISQAEITIAQLTALIDKESSNCDASKKQNLGQMVSESVKTKDGSAKDIVAYYKTKVGDVVSSNKDTATQIQDLKALKAEIDNMISELIKKQQNIDMKDMSQIVTEIKVSSNEIVADNVKIAATNKVFAVNIENNAQITPAEIKSTESGVTLSSEGVTATAEELTMDNSKVKVGNSEIKILPKEALEEANITSVSEIALVDENSKAVYKITTTEARKLFGLFSKSMDKQVNVDGANGDIISQQQPWWAFMTTEAADAENYSEGQK